MAGGEETGSLLNRKLNNSSTPPPPSYSMFQSMSSPAFNRSALTPRCSPSSLPVTNVAVVRAPLLDDRVVSAVMRSVPPLERALSVPDGHDSYVNVAVANDDDRGRRGRSGRGSLRAARRSDSARCERTVTADGGADQTMPLTNGATTTRRRARLQHSFTTINRADSSTSINLSRKSYERLTGLELPPSPQPNDDLPITPDTPIIITVATPSTAPSRRHAATSSTVAVHQNQLIRPHQPSHLPSPLPTIKMDENNVPQIDVAITPTSVYNGQTPMFTLGAPPPPRHRRPGSPTCRQRRQPPSRHGTDAVGTTSASAGAGIQVPTLTVTQDVDDNDSLISDYITPSPYFSSYGGGGGGNVDHLTSPFANVGDDISLYGTPKEEMMSPFRELDATRHRASNSPTNYLRDQIVAFFQPSDNKLAMKLFGNKNALIKEKLRQKAAGNWVIHPCSNFRLVTR